jgi:capsular exopolysaccharide synthesis family protein
LQFASIDRPLRQILLTSAQPEEGKSLTSANLSAALARAGKKVILVDADLHRPTQHRLFKLFNNIGVTTALLNEDVDYEMLLQPTTLPGLSLLTSGPLPPNPAELLGSKRMQEVLKGLQELADIVVIDSPPVTAVVDAMILANQMDGVLVVMRSEKSSRDAVKRALSALHQVKAPILGAVLNGISEHKKEYYLHNYGYYSSVYGRSLTSTNASPQAHPASEAPVAMMPVVSMPAAENPYAVDDLQADEAMVVPASQAPVPMPLHFSPQPAVYEAQGHAENGHPPYQYPIAHEPAANESAYAEAAPSAPPRPNGQRRSANILRRRSTLPWR